MKTSERYSQTKKITLLGVVVHAVLGLIKLIGGWLFHSHALIADGFHSFSDLLIDATVLFVSKYGNQDADRMHPYGHQRFETAGTLFLALILILVGIGIIWDSIDQMLQLNSEKPGWIALPIAIFSVLMNEGLFHYIRHVAKRVQSSLIMANAWHHRSDAAASLVVTLGLFGTLWGLLYLDTIAAIIVGCMIIKMGWDYGWSSVKELVDTAVEHDIHAKIEHAIQGVEGVEKIHQLRSRLMGGDVYIDVHVLVAPRISVSEGHYIAQQVHRTLKQSIPGVKDVTVHVDPEDDEVVCPSIHLLSRSQLEKNFLLKWQQDFPIQNWIIHYLDGEIFIDLVCDRSFSSLEALHRRVEQDLEQKLTNIRDHTNQPCSSKIYVTVLGEVL